MRLLLSAAVLLLAFNLTAAVPLPAQDDGDVSVSGGESAGSDSLEELADILHQISASSSLESSLKKRSPDAIPDVDLCNQHKHAKDSYEVGSEDPYERYFHIEKPYESEVRRKRQVHENSSLSQENSSEEKGDGKDPNVVEERRRKRKANDSSSEEDSSEEKGKAGAPGASGGEGAKGADGARRKRGADDSSSEEDSSEEKGKAGAPGASGGEGAKGADGARRKRGADDSSSEEDSTNEDSSSSSEEDLSLGKVRLRRNARKNTISHESNEDPGIGAVFSFDSDENNEFNEVIEPKKEDDSSLEDYVQGCEVMEADSDEANETTYLEDRRRRSVGNEESGETSKSLASNSVESEENRPSEESQGKSEETKESD